MTTKIFKPTGTLKCPYCDGALTGAAQDYVLTHSHSHAEEKCGHCDQLFLVRRQLDSNIKVTNNWSLVEIYTET